MTVRLHFPRRILIRSAQEANFFSDYITHTQIPKYVYTMFSTMLIWTSLPHRTKTAMMSSSAAYDGSI